MAVEADLERLYDAHAQALFAFLLNFVRDEDLTREELQEILLKLARQPGLLETVREPRHFLIRLAHNAALDLLRRRGTRERQRDALSQQAELFAPSTEPDEEAFRSELSAALGQLPPEQRTVVHLKLWEGLTFDEIAHTLEIPQNTAASRYRYGLDKLRNLLRPLYEELK